MDNYRYFKIKYRLKSISLFCLLLFCFSSPLAFADWSFKFANIICSPEMNYFQIRAVNIEDFYDIQQGPTPNQKLADEIAKKYLLYYGDIEKTCKLKQDTLLIKLTYEPAHERGMCGAEQPGTLTIKLNGRLLVDHIPFNATCDSPNVTELLYQVYDQSTGSYITVRGLKNWGLNNNNFSLGESLKDNKNLVINRTYFDKRIFK